MLTLPVKFIVSPQEAGLRLDRFVSAHSTELSRTRVQELIEAGLVVLNGKPAKDSQKVRTNDVVEVTPTPRPAMHAEAEQIPLNILYEDDELLVINKPAGLVCHPTKTDEYSKEIDTVLAHKEKEILGLA